MPELGPFAQIAPYLTHPLVLAGFGLLLFFGLCTPCSSPRSCRPSAKAQAARRCSRCCATASSSRWRSSSSASRWPSIRQSGRPSTPMRSSATSRRRRRRRRPARASSTPSRASRNFNSDAFRAAVVAIVRESRNPDAPRGIDRAIELLRQGETGAAESALTEILDRRLQERATASAEAAEAAEKPRRNRLFERHRQSDRSLPDRDRTRPGRHLVLDFLGRLYQRAGNLAAAEQAFRGSRSRRARR